MFIFAICNLLVLYYVVNNFHFENEKKFVSNFHSRLPKVSNQLDTEKPENILQDYSVNTGGSENPEHYLVNSMKNILIQQNKGSFEKVGLKKLQLTKKLSKTPTYFLINQHLFFSFFCFFFLKPFIYQSELNQEITTKEAVTIDQELAAKLLDSSEIELFTIKPVTYENPKLELDLPKLNTMV